MLGFLSYVVILCNTVGWIYLIYEYFHSGEWEHKKWVRSVMKSDKLTKEEKDIFYLREVVFGNIPFIIGF